MDTLQKLNHEMIDKLMTKIRNNFEFSSMVSKNIINTAEFKYKDDYCSVNAKYSNSIVVVLAAFEAWRSAMTLLKKHQLDEPYKAYYQDRV